MSDMHIHTFLSPCYSSPEQTIDNTAEKQQLITSYPDNWNQMISEWKTPSHQDAFWLMFSACYLFKTNNNWL